MQPLQQRLQLQFKLWPLSVQYMVQLPVVRQSLQKTWERLDRIHYFNYFCIMKDDNLYNSSCIYIIASALVFATTKFLCFILPLESLSPLIMPLCFLLATALYLRWCIEANYVKGNPRRKPSALFLAIYLMIALCLVWFSYRKHDALINFLLDTSKFHTYEDIPGGMGEPLYETNYRMAFSTVYSAMLTIVFLPGIIKAFRILVAKMRQRILWAASPEEAATETKRQRRAFFKVYVPTLLLMLPIIPAIMFIPFIVLQIVSMRWRQREKLFWLT